MFETMRDPHPVTADAAAEVDALVARLAELRAADAGESVELISALERLKGAAAAAQARATDLLDTIRQSQAEARRLLEPGRRHVDPDAGLGLELGLARRESPQRGRAHLRLARALHDLPALRAALTTGEISEHRAEIVVRETRHVSAEVRREVDAGLAHDFTTLGDARLLQATRRLVQRLDEEGEVRRREKARAERRVTSRVMGDGLTRLSLVLPSEQASAVWLTLDSATSTELNDDRRGRTRAQVMADLYAARLLGRHTVSAPPVALKLVMSAETLLGDDCEPAFLSGCGHVPASVARALVRDGIKHALTTVHRLFHVPGTAALVAMEADTRVARGLLRDFIEVRDRTCRTPYCDAPVRHDDHVRPVAADGSTSGPNLQGLCESCNHARETPGFRNRVTSATVGHHTVEVTTPTSTVHRSRAPDPPVPVGSSPAERHLVDVLWVA